VEITSFSKKSFKRGLPATEDSAMTWRYEVDPEAMMWIDKSMRPEPGSHVGATEHTSHLGKTREGIQIKVSMSQDH